MQRILRHPAAVLLFLACATAPQIAPNRYGLRVVPDLATYERLVRADPSQQLVDLAHVHSGRSHRHPLRHAQQLHAPPLYPVARAFLRRPAAEALRGVESDLAKEGLGLKIFDGYRPYSITEQMWEPIKNPDFVADPRKGSRHNRGAAVDLTVIDLATGRELDMPTPYDDFTSRARQDFNDLPPAEIANRAKLREAMVRHGFQPLPSEWWHFDFGGWQKFDLMDVKLEKL